MPTALNIKKTDPKIPSWWLFNELRKKGVEHIAAFSGELWTDHNLHDPGITILEVLCYAISDLGYRTNLDIEELLAPANEETENNFFTPEQILTCNPLTILDYRKMLVDIPGVRNAWILPSAEQEVALYIDCDNDFLQYSPVASKDQPTRELILNGLYKVYLDLDPILGSTNTLACENSSLEKDTVLEKVRKRLHQHRNLCEDFLDIIVLQDEQIGFCADLELDPNANPDEVLEAVYEAIENTLSPRLNFYSLKEMLEKGKSITDIFEGRPYTPAYGDRNGKFSHGFIDTAQLIASDLPEILWSSDYYQAIMEVEGVRAIKSLLLNNYKDGIPRTEGEEWALKLTKKHRPIFAPALSTFNFSKGVIRISANRQRVINRFKKRLQDFRKNKFNVTALDLAIPYGKTRPDLAHYPSIQHEFPLTYGIGKGHLSDKAPEKRKVEALQLKAYLTFYDQLLAGYLSQLANIRQLFSWDAPELTAGQTYFQQTVDNIPQAEKLFLSLGQKSQTNGWQEGDVIALPPQAFSHPTERDMAIIQLVTLFSTHSNNDENNIIDIVEEDGRYRFLVIGTDAEIVLQSKVNFESIEEAKGAAEQLFFQGTLLPSYQHTNWPEFSEYSFSFVYQPVNYTDYLKSITESREVYYARKDHFLNHLLARFGEQFTEYVLLMYALNQGAPDPKDIIQDKARFLANYPAISRNRGRGFDYTRQDNIWNSKENISGFERRVAGLMGLDQWERRYLNNFEVVLREQQSLLTIKDHRGTVLFETAECYIQDEIVAATSEFNKLLAKIANYEPFECPNQNVFGFRLLDTNGKVFANYPRTYGSAEWRDEILNCTHNHFSETPYIKAAGELEKSEISQANDFRGQVVNIVAAEEGYYFLLMADDGKEVYMKSSLAYETDKEACYAWAEFVKRAKSDDNYILVKGNYNGGPYSFVIYADDDQEEEVAFHPKGYSSKAVRTKKRKAISRFVKTKRLKHEICSLPDLYAWSAMDENGCLVLQSIHKFKSEEQARDAWQHFLKYAAEGDNYKQQVNGDLFSFTIEKEDTPIATSIDFSTEEECDQVLNHILEGIQLINAHGEAKILPQINTHTGKFYFVIFGDDGEEALIGRQYFDSEKEASCAYYHFLEKAVNAESYAEIIQEGTCLFSFEVKDAQTALAYHPKYYLKEEKEAIQAKLITYLKNNKTPLSIDLLAGSYHFEIDWESCEGHCETLFVENGEHLDEPEAVQAAISFLSNYKPDEPKYWATVDDNESYSFAIKGDLDIILVEHPQFYEKESKSSAVMADAQAFMNCYKRRDDSENSCGIIEEIAKWEVCGKSCVPEQTDEVCLMSGFRLSKTEAPLAYHPTTFDNVSTQNKMLDQLLLQAQCDQIYYATLCLQGTKITTEVEDKTYYELWENNGAKLLWRSFTSYNSIAEANDAFLGSWLKIIELARKRGNYKLPNSGYPYLSLWEDEQIVAFFPEILDSEEVAYDKIEFLCKTAKRFPLYRTSLGNHFRLQNNDCTKILWESSLSYSTEMEALQAFNSFLSLLKTRSSYRRNNNKEACIFAIEIGETLLEGNRTYADTFKSMPKRLARYREEFKTQKDAEEMLPTIFSATQDVIAKREKEALIEARDDLFTFSLRDSETDAPPLWESERGYSQESTAKLAYSLAEEQWLSPGQYQVEQLTTEKFIVTVRTPHFEPIDSQGNELDTVFAVCPALFKEDKVTLGGHELLVSEDCDEFAEAACVETICPAVWDEGLQSFLIHAIKDANYYPFVDYQQDCQWGFRVVTDQYRVARNVREFHLHSHQAQFKDWLYGYSRCDKDTLVDLPIAKLCRKNGLYHYYIEGDWRSFQGYETEALAYQAYNDELFDFYAYAQEVDFYELGKEASLGAGRPLQLLREDDSILALSLQTYQNAVEWNAAVLNRILLARKFPYFYFNGKYGFQCFAVTEAPTFERRDRTTCDPLAPELPETLDCEYDTSDMISVEVPGEVIWESIHEYNSPEEAQCVFEVFLQLLKDKQNYHSIQLLDCNLFGLEITHPKEVLATHPQRYTTKTELQKAIERTQNCINAEGFHLVEHILLRPKTGISNHISIQFLGREYQECIINEEPIFQAHPYLLIEQFFTDETSAQVFKGMLIDILVNYFKDEQGNLNAVSAEDLLIQLKSDQKYPFVIDNLSLFVEALIRTFQISVNNDTSTVSTSEGQFRLDLAKLIFCFNKSNSASSDKLIPNCPDCENIEQLPLEAASVEACIDPKKALAEVVSQTNTATENEISDYYIAGADPYSFWTTVILPYWPKRFQNANFRNFFENTLRRETPAHIGLKICWLDPKQMRRFERAYRRWLEAFSGNEDCNLQEARNRLICILFDKEEGISNVYPPALLQEGGCAPGGSSDPGAVLLDFTQLG